MVAIKGSFPLVREFNRDRRERVARGASKNDAVMVDFIDEPLAKLQTMIALD